MKDWWLDWAGMFIPDLSLIETFLRVSAVYVGLLVLFRLVLKRQAGGMGLSDILLAVLVSECVSPSLSGESKSVSNGLVAAGTILLWSYALDRLAQHSDWLRHALEPEPVPLVRDGQAIPENLEAEGLTREELESQLRIQGVEKIQQAKLAVLESDGQVSVIPADSHAPAAPSPPPSGEGLEGALERFRHASEELDVILRWHDEQARKHREAARQARAAARPARRKKIPPIPES